MQLQGIKTILHDLDIIAHLKYLKRIPKIFSEFTSQKIKKFPPITNELAWEVKLSINNMEFQIIEEKHWRIC